MNVYSTEGEVWGFGCKGWCSLIYTRQEYANRSSAERTRDHTSVKILIPSNKGEVVN